MEKYVDIWYIYDEKADKALLDSIEQSGLKINLLKGDLSTAEISQSRGNIFIIDFPARKPEKVIDFVKSNSKLEQGQKYIFVNTEEIEKANSFSKDMLNVEFIHRSAQPREFVILLEKSAIVEKYREVIKSFSRKTDAGTEAYQHLIKIQKHYPFESEIQKKALEKIIFHEKSLLKEQQNLNDAIKEFTSCHQKSVYELQSLLEAGELLNELRNQELIYADSTIKAQQNVIEFSANEIAERIKILEAQERTYELSREELIALHEQLKALKMENEQLKAELKKLKG